jgi:Holliday junction resolvase
MGGAMSRNKGARAERELAAILADELGIPVARNLNQPREGGADLPIPGWCIEVKRQEKASMTAWWAQTVGQATDMKARPALLYRGNRRPWKAIVWLPHMSGHYSADRTPMDMDTTAEISLPAFIQLVRETWPEAGNA